MGKLLSALMNSVWPSVSQTEENYFRIRSVSHGMSFRIFE